MADENTGRMYQIDIHKSMGGRGSNDQWSNSYHVQIDDDLTSENFETMARAIVAAEVAGHVSEVHFMRAHCRQRADNIINTPSKEFRTIELEDRGAREVSFITIPSVGEDPVYANPIAPLNLCIEVARSAASGRAGRVYYRGCLLVGDLQPGTIEAWTLKEPTLWSSLGGGQDVMIDMLNTALPFGRFVIPSKAGITLQTSRDVTKHSLAGVVDNKRRRHRITTQAELVKAARREFRDLIREAKKILGGSTADLLTGAAEAAFALLAGRAATAIAALPAEAVPYVLELTEAGELALIAL